MIPPLIHQTFIGSVLPLEIAQLIASNRRVCKNIRFLFYDDRKCDGIIAKYFGPRVLAAYRKINPHLGAMKSDFFRYCVLFLYGGIYMDIKTKLFINPFVLFDCQKENCVLDIKRNDLEPWRKEYPTYEQWMLIFAPRHPYLWDMIMHIVVCVETKFIPKEVENANTKKKILFITGPDAFTRVVDNFIATKNNNQSLHKCLDYTRFFKYNLPGINYKKIYVPYNRKHYSDYNEQLYL
jgi:inositol phosphorylceramide mannosyltransferase catalytic subunit